MLESFSLPPEAAARFWAKVDVRGADDCWPWTGRRVKAGYGQVTVAPRVTVYAHRVAGYLAGRLRGVTEALHDDWALHSCDNPPCCNPAHISAGTHADNMLDSARKGRMARKLTADDVAEILTLVRAGVPQREIARAKGIVQASVSRIARRASWRWLSLDDLPHEDRSRPARRPTAPVIRRSIEELLMAGVRQREVAARFKLHPSIVSRCASRMRERHARTEAAHA